MWQMILIIIICFLPGYFCSEKYCKLVGLEPGLRGKTFIVQVFALDLNNNTVEALISDHLRNSKKWL